MSEGVTLEEVEQLAAELPPREQLKLLARISQWLSAMSLTTLAGDGDMEQEQMERLEQIDSWIARCEEVAILWEGEFDSAADLRRIRDEG